jgi:hypothetical protein
MSNNNEKLVKDIRRRSRKKYSSEEKIRIVLEGMRGEDSIAELKKENGQLKRLVADIMLKNDVLKKVCLAWSRPGKTNEPVSGRKDGSHSLGRRI